MDAHSQILEAAIEQLAEAGYEGFTISAVARAAGVSRPTIYAHFGTLERLAAEALETASVRAISQVVERAKAAESAAEFVVEVMVAARAEFQRNPALSQVAFPERGTVLFENRGAIVGAHAVRLARSFLLPLLDYRPDLADELDDIAETTIRFMLSFVLFESEASSTDERLRTFLYRRVIPGLGLT